MVRRRDVKMLWFGEMLSLLLLLPLLLPLVVSQCRRYGEKDNG